MDKPLRLIELFAGYGSQALALKYLNIPFEHWFVCDFDKYAIQSYNDIHNTNFIPTDITKINATDLNICDTNKYDYLMTYSFPCTDLSIAGQQKGMSKGSGTRSGLLWEVERLLTECNELPQYLLMENVPQVIGKNNINDFKEWCNFLVKLGYTNSYKILNAKDYGIPQNRERCFMISTLNGKKYKFPEKQRLNLRINDLLDTNISNNKYYLPEKYLKNIEYIDNSNEIANLHYTTYQQSNKVYSIYGISPTLRASEMEFDYLKSTKIGHYDDKLIIRLLTPKEHLRLMGLSNIDIDKFTVNGNQQCKQAGNSIVVNVLMAIFKNLFIDEKFETTLF